MRIFELDKLPSWEEMKYEAVRIGLQGCEVFKMLDDETKSKEWNGLGPDRLPKIIRDFLDKLFVEVLPAACIHDFRFVIGGTKKDFHEANVELKWNMDKCLRFYRRKFTMVGYWLAKLRVVIAYHLCENFGYEGWNKKNETV